MKTRDLSWIGLITIPARDRQTDGWNYYGNKALHNISYAVALDAVANTSS